MPIFQLHFQRIRVEYAYTAVKADNVEAAKAMASTVVDNVDWELADGEGEAKLVEITTGDDAAEVVYSGE